jgi:Bacterial PH domain
VIEYDHEPVPGLPEQLPEGEHIIWQGSPNWRGMAKGPFHIRGVSIYFAILAGMAGASGSLLGLGLTVAGGAAGVALLALLGWLSARTTIYTITNKRVVMRFGMALQKCINLPLTSIGSAGLSLDRAGRGNIPLRLCGAHRLGYLQFWPHARPWRVAQPEPMLRAVPDGAKVAEILAQALRSANPGSEARNVVAPAASAPAREAMAA